MQTNRENPDQCEQYESSGEKHPTPEQLLLRMAIDKALNKKQKSLWELYNYDRLTTVEIGKMLGLDQSTISRNLQVIKRKVTKWCQCNMEVYNTLKEAVDNADKG